MQHIEHAFKYLTVAGLIWLACFLSQIHLTVASAALFGAIGAILEWLYKVWLVKQMTTMNTNIVEAVKRASRH